MISYNTNLANLTTIKNSLFFTLPLTVKKFKKTSFKTAIVLRGFYIDKVLKDIIYVASYGFNKNFFFRSSDFRLQYVNRENPHFVTLLNKTYKYTDFICLPEWHNKYIISRFIKKKFKILKIIKNNKKRILQYYKKQVKLIQSFKDIVKIKRRVKNSNGYFTKLLRKKLLKNTLSIKQLFESKRKIYFPFSKYIKKYYSKTRLLRSGYYEQYIIRRTYRKLYFLLNLGKLRQRRKDIFARQGFSGLVFILSIDIKKVYIKVFKLFNLLANFYIQSSLSVKYSKNILSRNILYFIFYKFLYHSIKKYLKREKLKYRKTNQLLFKYFRRYRLKKRFTYILKNLLHISQSRAISTKPQYAWANIAFFNKNSIYTLLMDDETVLSRAILPLIKTIDKVKIIKYLTIIILLNEKIIDRSIIFDSKLDLYLNLKLEIFNYIFKNLIQNRLYFNTFLLFFKQYNLFSIQPESYRGLFINHFFKIRKIKKFNKSKYIDKIKTIKFRKRLKPFRYFGADRFIFKIFKVGLKTKKKLRSKWKGKLTFIFKKMFYRKLILKFIRIYNPETLKRILHTYNKEFNIYKLKLKRYWYLRAQRERKKNAKLKLFSKNYKFVKKNIFINNYKFNKVYKFIKKTTLNKNYKNINFIKNKMFLKLLINININRFYKLKRQIYLIKLFIIQFQGHQSHRGINRRIMKQIKKFKLKNVLSIQKRIKKIHNGVRLKKKRRV